VPKEEEYPTALHKKLEVIISKIKDMERENASLQEENQVLRKQLERIKGTVNDLLELAV
jgi:regulator of replication initiation timing